MKKILIATDHSTVAQDAGQYAVKLAEKWLEEAPAGEMILKSHAPLLVLPEATWC
jgi:hypothetical protein